jgi:hypothetical protein
MGKIKVVYDLDGETLTLWFDDPAKERLCEESTEEVVFMKDAGGKVIGLELLHFQLSEEQEGLVVETVVRRSARESGSKTSDGNAKASVDSILRGARLNWQAVRRQYDVRLQVSERLIRLLSLNNAAEFARVAMGISDPNGNYSAREHGLGPRILAENPNAAELIMSLACKLANLQFGSELSEAVSQAAITNLGIAVGSELGCLMNPKICWITNRRTVWAYYLLKNRGLYQSANEATKLSAEHGWSAFHDDIQQVLLNLAGAGSQLARAANIEPGGLVYLWGDAIANELYERYYH